MEQYFQMLVSSGTITMREFLMMQGLMDIIMEHCPAERKHSAVKDAVHRISRIIKEENKCFVIVVIKEKRLCIMYRS